MLNRLNFDGLRPLSPSNPASIQDVEARDGVLVLSPRGLGLGCDSMIGGRSGRSIRKIDLSRLTYPVSIQWVDAHSGSITDGADTIVFQGVEEIILPACMQTKQIDDYDEAG